MRRLPLAASRIGGAGGARYEDAKIELKEANRKYFEEVSMRKGHEGVLQKKMDDAKEAVRMVELDKRTKTYAAAVITAMSDVKDNVSIYSSFVMVAAVFNIWGRPRS